MSNEIAVRETSQLIDWDCPNQLKSIKDIYAKKATNEEFAIFVNLGKATGLSPFLREIWLVKYGDSPASIFIGRDGYRKSAQANPNYDFHHSDAVYSNDNFKVVNGEFHHEYCLKDRGVLIGAYSITKRKSSSRPHHVFVELKEYDKQQSNWKTMKATMIKKVAEAQCLRMAFQELFANTYCPEEYEPIDNSQEGKKTRASDKISQLIEGKVVKSGAFEECLEIIAEAQNLDDLLPIPKLTNDLTVDEKKIVRASYKAKVEEINAALVDNAPEQVDKGTGEIFSPSDYEKIKNQLLSAKSLETLQLAADLISSIDGDTKKEELMGIYSSRIEEVS